MTRSSRHEPTELTRRQFLRNVSFGGLGILGGVSFVTACAGRTLPTISAPSSPTVPAATTGHQMALPPLVPEVQVPPDLPLGPPIAITNVAVFDGDRLLGPTTVVMSGGLVSALGDDAVVPAEAEVVDGTDKTLIPGLIDAHTHSFLREPSQSLLFGVSTQMEMLNDIDTGRMEDQRLTGRVTHADVFNSGLAATSPGGHGTQFGLELHPLEHAGEAAAWVEARRAEGSHYIKVMVERCCGLNPLSPEIVTEVVAEANRQGLLAIAHAMGSPDTEVALDAGVQGLAHTLIDGRMPREMMQRLKQSRGFVITTLGGKLNPEQKDILRDDGIVGLLPEDQLESLASDFFANEERLRNGLENVAALVDEGVPVLAGTDAGNAGTTYGAGLLVELELMADAGVSPTTVIAAATSAPADAFGLLDRGRLHPGLRADAILVDGDPIADIKALRRIDKVWKLGVEKSRQSQRRGRVR